MKRIIKLSLIFLLLFSILSGCYLCTYENSFSKLLYKVTFYTENIKNYICDILLQKQNINNLTIKSDTSNLMNEYFITFFNNTHLNNINSINKIEKICESSNFSILNCKNINPNEPINESYTRFQNKDNFFIIENTPCNLFSNYKTLNENLFRFYQYNNFSVSYSNHNLLNYKDMLSLYKYITTLNNSFYIPIIMLNNNNLNKELLKYLTHTNALFVVLGENFSILPYKKIPIVQIDSKASNSFIQLNLFISDANLKKLRFKIFPLDENGNTPSKEYIQNLLQTYNSNSINQFFLGENQEYIYVDYNI